MKVQLIRTLLAAAVLGCSSLGMAQTVAYPQGPVRVIVATTAGSATDSLARAMAEELRKELGQSVIVDNKPGASGIIGAQALASAAPDGHTIGLIQSTPFLYAPHTVAKLPYDVKQDFTFIRPIAGTQFMLAVNKDVPASNMDEFMAWAKQNQGKISYGSYGTGGAGHLISAYLSDSNKLNMVHAPYKGEIPMIQDLLGGQISWAIGTKGTMLPHITSGRIRALAVMGDKRFADLPSLPTMAEAGFPEPEFKPVGWFAMVAPAGTPAEIVSRIDKESRKAMDSPKMQALFQLYGMEPMYGSAADFRRDFAASDPLIAKLIKMSGVVPE